MFSFVKYPTLKLCHDYYCFTELFVLVKKKIQFWLLVHSRNCFLKSKILFIYKQGCFEWERKDDCVYISVQNPRNLYVLPQNRGQIGCTLLMTVWYWCGWNNDTPRILGEKIAKRWMCLKMLWRFKPAPDQMKSVVVKAECVDLASRGHMKDHRADIHE